MISSAYVKVRYYWTTSAVCLLLFGSFSPCLFSQERQQLPTGPKPDQRQIDRINATAKRLDSLLKESALPISGFDLIARNWRDRIREKAGFMPQFTESRRITTSELAGVYIGDEVELPEHTILTSDVLIIANRIRFLGSDIRISGPHAVFFFALESTRTESPRGKITINTSGLGRREAHFAKCRMSGETNCNLDGSPYTSSEVLRLIEQDQNTSGAPGQDGPNGTDGSNGQNGSDGTQGSAGSCFTRIYNGGNGTNGSDGTAGLDGGDGGNGTAGDDAQPIIFHANPNDTNQITLIARGGNGGKGGNGGHGGSGGRGGDGGKGGNGAGCSCNEIGDGGNGGAGGDGGARGFGGNGGNGANGGRGGDITIYYPQAYNLALITTVNAGGSGGGGGDGGHSGFLGVPGTGGNRGEAGSYGSCSGIAGNAGLNGNYWPFGGTASSGGHGAGGGEAGNLSHIPTGGSGGYYEPGGFGNGCTHWFWVWYTCTMQNELADGKFL